MSDFSKMMALSLDGTIGTNNGTNGANGGVIGTNNGTNGTTVF